MRTDCPHGIIDCAHCAAEQQVEAAKRIVARRQQELLAAEHENFINHMRQVAREGTE